PLQASSSVGRGSMFSILVPRAAQATDRVVPVPAINRSPDTLAGLRVLCVDNDQEILDGMRALLGRWEIDVVTATTVDEALQSLVPPPDVMLIDYHLHDRMDGLDCLDALRERCSTHVAGVLLTADGRDELQRETRER